MATPVSDSPHPNRGGEEAADDRGDWFRMLALTEAHPGEVIQGVIRIFALWNISDGQARVILGLSAKQYGRWHNSAPAISSLRADTIERISIILGIYAALRVLLPDPPIANSWVLRPNTTAVFGGTRPLDYMLRGNVSDLRAVRAYLEGERWG